MPFGFRTIIKKIIIAKDKFKFSIYKKLLGFDNATKILYSCIKESIIPILKANGATIGEGCDIESPIIFHNAIDFTNLSIGNNCHIGKNCFFDLRDNINIENNVTISMNTSMITHIQLGQATLNNIYKTKIGKIFINNGVYVGSNCNILMDVTIYNDCLIGANSLVNKTIPSKSIAYGNPIRIIKKIDI